MLKRIRGHDKGSGRTRREGSSARGNQNDPSHEWTISTSSARRLVWKALLDEMFDQFARLLCITAVDEMKL